MLKHARLHQKILSLADAGKIVFHGCNMHVRVHAERDKHNIPWKNIITIFDFSHLNWSDLFLLCSFLLAWQIIWEYVLSNMQTD